MNESNATTDASFSELFSATYSQVVAYARRRSFDKTEADDIVSEVYTIAWRKRDELRPDQPPLPWLYTIAGNVLRNHWRAGGRRLRLVERLEAEPGGSASHDPAEADGQQLRDALLRLSFDDQEVLRLVAWEGLSHREVGEVLGCTTNAVGIRIHRAKQRLEAELSGSQDPAERQGGAVT